MTLRWVDLTDAADMVLSGRIVNSIAVAGILAACRVEAGQASPRDVAEPFEFRPTSLAERRAAAGIVPDMKRI